MAALGAESGISKSEVSRICAGLDEMVEVFRGRRLDHVEFPYVYLDATYLKVRNSVSQVASMAMVVATGVTADGNREILGCDIGDSESEGFWQSFLGSLRARGLTGVAPGDSRRLESHLEHPDRALRQPHRRPHPMKTITAAYTKFLTVPSVGHCPPWSGATRYPDARGCTSTTCS